jgi:hypothetical protein
LIGGDEEVLSALEQRTGIDICAGPDELVKIWRLNVHDSETSSTSTRQGCGSVKEEKEGQEIETCKRTHGETKNANCVWVKEPRKK